MWLARRTSIVGGIACVAVALSGPTGEARDASNKAQKVVTKQTAKALEAMEADLKALAEELDLQLDDIDDGDDSGSLDFDDTMAVYQAVKVFQRGIRDAIDVAIQDLFLALESAQPILDGAGIDSTSVPKGLAFGDGGICDEYRESVLKLVDRALRKAEKRVRATGKRFLKHANVAIQVRLDHPRGFWESTGRVDNTFTDVDHSVAILMSASVLGDPRLNVIFAFGSCHQNDLLTQVQLLDSNNQVVSVSPSLGFHFWEEIFLNPGTGYFVLRVKSPIINSGGAHGAIHVR